MSGTGASKAAADPLTRALALAPDGVALLDADWTITYINTAGADLLGRPTAELIGRTLWVALPELGGTVLHSFLLHARGAGESVTWQGFHAPSGRWLWATATVDEDGTLQLYFREADNRLLERPPAGLHPDESPGRDRLRFLAEVNESLIATLDTGESAATLAKLVVPRLADWATVTVLTDDGGRQHAHVHRDPARQADLDACLNGRTPGSGDDSPLVTALLSGEPVRLATIDTDLVEPSLTTEHARTAWRRLDSTSATVVPLRARGETFGALVLVNTGLRPAHTDMEVATAVEVARRGALALDNARLYGRQLKVAETLQHSLLTPPPQPDDLHIAVRYRPAADHQRVGGDWYDSFIQRDGTTLLVIGDVVGHDLAAAAAMAQIRSILRGIAYDHPRSPGEILHRVDRVLTGLHPGILATALVARVEQPGKQAGTGQRTLRWSSAGHLPPLHLTADGHVALLDGDTDRLLGVGTNRRRVDHETSLRPGDTVVFYTDGLVEHGRIGIDEGLARLTEALTELAGLPAERLCDELLGRIVPARADDDIALLVMQCDVRPGIPVLAWRPVEIDPLSG